MTRYIQNFILFLTALTSLTGCYTDFEPDLKSTPVVCINSLITAGKEINVEVTRTWRYSEGSPAVELDIDLKDAVVQLYVNDEFKERLVFTVDSSYIFNIKKYYASKYIPRSGDRIRIHAMDKTYGEAEAEVTVPFPVAIDKVDYTITKNKVTYGDEGDSFKSDFEMLLNVKFTDPAGADNFYIFDMPEYLVRTIDEEENGYFQRFVVEQLRINPDYGFDPIFSEHITPIETVITDAYGLYTVFSDRQFSGGQYGLAIPLTGHYYCDYIRNPDLDDKFTLDVELSHISRAYYNYMLSLWAATEGVSGALGDVGLGDPVFEHSNVSTGAGIVAAQATSTLSLDIHDILGGE